MRARTGTTGAGAPVAGALLVALTAAVVAQGGFSAAGQRVVAVLVAAAIGLAVLSGAVRAADLRSAPALAAGALVGWALLDGALHGDSGAGVRPALLVLGVAGVFLAARGGMDRELLAGGLLGIGGLVAATGWLGVALHRQPWAIPGQGTWRAAGTLTYPNAAAAVLVPIALAALTGRRGAGRATATAGVLAGLAATGSRAGLLALAVGLVVLAVRTGPRVLARTAAGPVAGAAVVALGLVPTLSEGDPARPLPALLALLALAAGLALAAAPDRVTLAAAPVAVLGAAVAVAGPLRDRLTPASPDRVGALRAAGRLVADAPLTGQGPGAPPLRWTDAAGAAHAIGYAHDEYVQVAVELGLVGLVLLLALLAALARRTEPAIVAAVAVHGALDFVWHLPAVPLLAAALLGLAAGRPNRAPAATPAHDPGRDRVPVRTPSKEHP